MWVFTLLAVRNCATLGSFFSTGPFEVQIFSKKVGRELGIERSFNVIKARDRLKGALRKKGQENSPELVQLFSFIY